DDGLPCLVMTRVQTCSLPVSCTAAATGAGIDAPGIDVTPATYPANVNVGTATADATWAGDANHTGNSGESTFDIAQAPSTVTVTCPATAQTYTGSAIEPCTAAATGAGIDAPGIDVTPVTYTANVNVGTATADATWAGDANHTGNSGESTFDIAQAPSTVTVKIGRASCRYTGSATEPGTAT